MRGLEVVRLTENLEQLGKVRCYQATERNEVVIDWETDRKEVGRLNSGSSEKNVNALGPAYTQIDINRCSVGYRRFT